MSFLINILYLSSDILRVVVCSFWTSIRIRVALISVIFSSVVLIEVLAEECYLRIDQRGGLYVRGETLLYLFHVIEV